ncbi:MAG: preprotein translocase subunit YajC [Lutibacter sp.]|jgi:preprotein translocase subunit YajC|nr:preprotein translocase subunit YajC [Lutibacter sp.]
MFNTLFLQSQGSSLSGMLPFLLMFLVLYFFMIRPQMKRQKNEKKFQSQIAKGSKVVTSSGIHGKVVDIVSSDNTVIIETGAGKIKFDRTAISMELSKRYQPSKGKK